MGAGAQESGGAAALPALPLRGPCHRSKIDAIMQMVSFVCNPSFVLVKGKSIIIHQLWLLFSFFKMYLITVG